MNGLGIAVETPLSVIGHAPFTPGKTIREYFDEQAFPSSVPVIFVCNEVPVRRADWDRPLTCFDRGAFVILPQNGGLKSIIGVVAQIAVTIGVTVLTGGNIALGLAAGAAVGAILNLVLQPKVANAEGAEASPTYSLQAQGNQARLMNPIPRGYGLHNMFMDFAAQPYTTYEGNDQYLFQLFVRGVGFYDTQTVRIGDTDLWRKATGFTDSFEDVELQFIEPGQPVTLFPAAVQTSAEVAGADLLSGATIGGYIVNAAGTVVNRLAYDFVFSAGLFKADKKGKLGSRSVSVTIEYQEIDNTGTAAGPWVVAEIAVFTARTSTAQRYTKTFVVPDSRYQGRVTRVTADAGDDTTVSDKVQWTGLRGFQPSTNVYPDVSLLAVKIKATNQLSQQSSRLFNVIQIAKLPVWNGEGWSDPQPTRSIAWAAADMLRNPIYGEGRQDSMIDLDKLLQLDATWFARNDTFNGVFDTKQTFWDALAALLLVGRTQPMLIAGVMTFVRDEPRTIPKGVFTSANMTKGSFGTTHLLYRADSPDDVIVEYIDERTWKQAEVQCTLDGSTSDEPTRISLFGATNYAQAWREGIYHAASNAYRRIIGQLTSEMEGKLLIRGDAVTVSHDMPKWGSAGEVEFYDTASRTVLLTEPGNWSNGPFSIIFSDRRNRQWGPVAVTRGASNFEAVIDEDALIDAEAEFGPLAPIIVTDPNKIATRFIQNNSIIFAKRFVATSIVPQGLDRSQIALVNDDPRVYTADLGVPPEEAAIGGLGRDPSAPAIDGLRVTLDPSSGASPVLLSASWAPSRGATAYVVQYSYDGASYDTVYEGSGTSVTFLAQANDVIVRAAAIGNVRGPWTYVEYDFDPENKVPEAVTDLSVTVATDQSVVTADWFPGQYASAYAVEIVVEA